MTATRPKVVIVGGGIGGAAAALRCARDGAEVVVLERSDHLGGLVMSLDVGGTPLERFYHHIFPHEADVISLIEAMGLAGKLEWFRSSVGMLVDGRVWPFTSPLDLLRFGPLPLVDRLHTGLGALRSMRWDDWASLDGVPAAEWLTGLTGRRGFEAVWAPLLRAKFGSAAPDVPGAWMLGRLQQRAAARRRGVERLGYMRGGFRQLFDALEGALSAEGVQLRLGATATGISVSDGAVIGVSTDSGPVEADTVIYAGTLPGIVPLVDPAWRDPRWEGIGGMGAMAVVLELRRSVTDAYWVNVCDAALPFTAYIEHTNLVPASDYGGRHLAYLARYFTPDDPLAGAAVDVEAVAWRWVDALSAGRLAGFDRADVVAVHPARTTYAAPLVQRGHLARIPPVRSHIAGLYVATTAQIYPQDRGMSEGIRLGDEAARRARADRADRPEPADPSPPAWFCPVCSGTLCRARFATGAATEGGVEAEAFRPSSQRFGQPIAAVVACERCGHGRVAQYPPEHAIAVAYDHAADPVSLREEAGQVCTARRALARIEQFVAPGRLLDIGCWTGSFLAAAAERGWQAHGVEPSRWAGDRARLRGLDVVTGSLAGVRDEAGSADVVVMSDVLEHLADPGDALDEAHRLLAPGGALYITVPDAGSRIARLLGRRWWSVLPMHLQYFTRASLLAVLSGHGFRVVACRRHTKLFSTRYYAEQLAGYAPGLSRLLVAVLSGLHLSDRLISPDFGDRLEVIALPR